MNGPPATVVTTRQLGEVVVIEIAGPLTLGSGGDQALAREVVRVLNAGERRLVLDLGRVTKVDSSGLGELIAAAGLVSRRDGGLAVANAPGQLWDFLQATMVDPFPAFGGGPYDSVWRAVQGLLEIRPRE